MPIDPTFEAKASENLWQRNIRNVLWPAFLQVKAISKYASRTLGQCCRKRNSFFFAPTDSGCFGQEKSLWCMQTTSSNIVFFLGGETMQWWYRLSGWHSFWDFGHGAIVKNCFRERNSVTNYYFMKSWTCQHHSMSPSLPSARKDNLLHSTRPDNWLKGGFLQTYCVMCIIMSIIARVNFQQKGRSSFDEYLCAITAS